MEAGLAEEVEGGEGETIRQRRITHMLCARDEKMKGLKLIGAHRQGSILCEARS